MHCSIRLAGVAAQPSVCHQAYHYCVSAHHPRWSHHHASCVQVGQKVRVVGAELRSDRAAEPLEAARTALLRVSFNGVSPAPWDAKLGPVPGETLRWGWNEGGERQTTREAAGAR